MFKVSKFNEVKRFAVELVESVNRYLNCSLLIIKC